MALRSHRQLCAQTGRHAGRVLSEGLPPQQRTERLSRGCYYLLNQFLKVCFH